MASNKPVSQGLRRLENSLKGGVLGQVLQFAKAGERPAVYDLSDGQRAFLCAALSDQLDKKVVYVAANRKRAESMCDDVRAYLGERECRTLTGEEVLFVGGVSGHEGEKARLEWMTRLAEGRLSAVFCVPEDLMLPLMPMQSWRDSAVTLSQGQGLDMDTLREKLQDLGYERRDMVEDEGQCAYRGDIADIWPCGWRRALRVEFFGDEIDLIRTFDPVTQRSVDRITGDVRVFPARTYLAAKDKATLDRMREMLDAQVKRLKDGEIGQNLRSEAEALREADENGYGGTLTKWARALGLERHGIWEWFDEEPLIILDEPEKIKERFDDRESAFQEDLKAALERGDALPEWEGALFTPEEMTERLNRTHWVSVQSFLRGMGGFKPGRVLSWPGTACPRYFSRVRDLAEDIRTAGKEKRRLYLCAGGETRYTRLQNALSEFNLDLPVLREGDTDRTGILDLTLGQGFILTDEGLGVISDADIFGSARQVSAGRKKRAVSASQKLEAFTDLTEGDPVVHESHGIGIYRGTVRLQSEGTWRDYFLIQYKGSDRLYVPTDQFDRMQKFIGGDEDHPPELSSLGSGSWQKQRKKVSEGLKKLAFDLVKLYAERQTKPGFAFLPDTPWQAEFEDAFPFRLTEDQSQAVAEIKSDMEKPVNMDRLLCGDVGYGKTEVALRAAFKCIMSGKQAAILCPTTILCQQHFYTIQRRFRDFPVKAEVLSRFRTAKEVRQILEDLKDGRIDIVVGTHKLLGKNVVFKDLGLLIVDEEQRFGVGHKEKIKNYKTQVDVLTLSATPIPRTLHMSMIGVRDMSVLSEPPEERLPVQTYVVDYSDSVVRDAVLREIGRGGQTYIVYNYVQHIDAFAAHLRALLPDVRLAVAHGQMPENVLENVMLDFYDHKYDVLLCSTIIENGLDVSNANTMLVYDADRFGLSQLYQLRGRVGRSDRAAFAFFMVKKDKMLSETAEKRLNALREFTAFGSGFRVAMRDLEIRGSGNIFGPEQSGSIAAVGYDMYCRMIEDAVRAYMPGTPLPERIETRMELKVDAYLPQNYVRDERQRMEVFKRISMIRTREDREDVIEELIDRFGDVPESVMNLIDVAHLKALAGRLMAKRVSALKGVMSFSLAACPDPMALYQAITETDKRLVFSAQREQALLFRDPALSVEGLLREAVPVLEKLNERMDALTKTGETDTIS